jgi:hypothetical protein
MAKTKETEPTPKAGPPAGEMCSTCQYYFTESGKTRCRAIPPYALMGGGGQLIGRVWPEVGANDWCGNWQ